MATVDLYLLTEETIVRVSRQMRFERVPVVGEFVRIEAGGLFPQRVTEVAHDVDGSARIVLGVQKNADGKYDLWDSEADLRDDLAALEDAGWVIRSEVPNRAWRNDGT